MNKHKKIAAVYSPPRRSGISFSGYPQLALVYLGFVLMAGAFGCVSTPRSLEALKTSAEPTASTQPAVSSKATTSAAAQQPGEKEPSLLIQELSAREESGQTVLFLKLSQPISQYRHFPVTQPSRVILDMFGDAKPKTDVQTFRITTSVVNAVRVSFSEGYVRMTIETAAASPPPYLVTPEEGGLQIVVGAADAKATAKRQLALVRDGKRVDTGVAEVKTGATESSGGPSRTEDSIAETKKYTGQKLSFDFKDADIKNVFRLLAEVSGLNIVVTADVNRRVTLRLVEVPWDQAMDLLIDTNGLGKEQIGNVVRISTAGQLKSERDALVAAKKSEENLEPLQTAYYKINYAKVKDLEPKLKSLMSKRVDASLVVDERSNTLMIRDIKKSVDDAQALVTKLDTRTPQVLIESNLVETTPTFSRALGTEIDFVYQRAIASSRFLAGNPFEGSPNSLAPPFPVPATGLRLGIAANNVNAFITAAEKEGNIKIVSRPSIVTLNNVASTIESLNILRVRRQAATVGEAGGIEQIRVGITLKVTPQVSADGFVLLNIEAKSSTVGSRIVDGIPEEISREAKANVLVRDGETVVIGGIMKDTSSTSDSGIPYLKDVPFIGWLFKKSSWQKDFEELVVFITPRIVEAGSEDLPTAEQIWRNQLKQTQGS